MNYNRILWKTKTFFASLFKKDKQVKIPISVANDEDLEKLGRKKGDYVSHSHLAPKPYLVYDLKDRSKEIESIEADLKYHNAINHPKSNTMQCIRNKKTGRVVICPGNLEYIKKMYNDDWEIVESELK